MSPATGAGQRAAQRWPPVAVVVATRDRPGLLERAIGGIMDQAYPGEIECLVVFDQSAPRPVTAADPGGRPPGTRGGGADPGGRPPGTARGGASHGERSTGQPDRRLRVLANGRSAGLAGARNTGIVSSRAPLIAFCDDDDVWVPDKLRLQVECLRSGAAEFVAGGVRIHHADRVITRIPPASVELSQLVRERVAALHPSTFLFPRDLVDQVGLVDEAIPGSYGEDYDWLLRAAKRMPIASVQQPLADVYWHKQSFFAERWATVAGALEYLLGKHPELMADPAGRARIQGQIAFAQAALAHRSAALRASRQALRGNPKERRAYLALAVASGLPATAIVRLANRRGRGI